MTMMDTGRVDKSASSYETRARARVCVHVHVLRDAPITRIGSAPPSFPPPDAVEETSLPSPSKVLHAGEYRPRRTGRLFVTLTQTTARHSARCLVFDQIRAVVGVVYTRQVSHVTSTAAGRGRPTEAVERQAASSAVSKASSSSCDLRSKAFAPASLGAAMAALAARGDASSLPLSEDEQDGASPRPLAAVRGLDCRLFFERPADGGCGPVKRPRPFRGPPRSLRAQLASPLCADSPWSRVFHLLRFVCVTLEPRSRDRNKRRPGGGSDELLHTNLRKRNTHTIQQG